MKIHPPKRALRFLRWFCRVDYLDEIEGDLIELFEKQCETYPSKAGRIFTWNVLKHFRPEYIKSFKSNYHPNTTAMFRHNLLIAYRNFARYKNSFFINLIGLSSGLACVLLIYLWVNDELRMDKFHQHGKQLYQILENVEQDGRIITRRSTCGPMAEGLAEEMPEVQYAVTATFDFWNNDLLTVGDNNIKATGKYVSVDFLKLFSYELAEGNPDQVLKDKKSILLTEDLALRLFGTTENLIGKTVEWQHDRQYHVTGILKNIPSNSSVKFEYLLTFEEFREQNKDWVTSWFNTAPQTFVLLREGTNVDEFSKKAADMLKRKTEGKANHRTPFATRYNDLYLYGNFENGKQSGGRIEYVKLFSIIAAFILLIGCINFMNLSTARASRRIKEVGMKKAVGARRSTLVVQYLSESLLIALMSLALALLFVFLFLPHFNTIVEKQLALHWNKEVAIALGCIIVLTGLLAGSYPALYLSKFSPAVVLKGKVNNFLGETWARKGLVVFQFTLSIVLIVSVWIVYQQIRFTQTKNLGYDKSNILMFGADGKIGDKKDALITEIQKIPGVSAATSGGHNMMGHNGGTYGIEWPGKDSEDRTEFERMPSNYGLIELLDIKMKEGRTFSRDYSDTTSIIFNEAAIKFMGLTDPLGKTVKLWGKDMQIIGVTKDFNFESLHEPVKPAFFWMAPYSWNIMVKIQAGKEQDAIAKVEHLYQEFNPGFPFSYHFLDQDYDKLYSAEHRVSILSKYFAGLAILISCLGLFGLAAFTAERRIKEIGIRKVLGSSNFAIVQLLSAEYTKMVLAAICLALPLSYFAASRWLDSFVFRIELKWWFFAGAGVSALLIAWFTVGLLTVKAARINPADCLRSE
ncbi:MAG TPA: ABC transporter permease [Cyclobacteriaceae bacterium]|nr:ABC transporter permease [Cyclobacteriaceae bacterium]